MPTAIRSACRGTKLLWAALAAWIPLPASAADWPRFRGDNGSGVSPDSTALPTEWSESKNLKWSVDLPGPGKSSPIIVGDRVILTAWSGENPPEDLKRHLLCFDRRTGKELWSKTIEPRLEDEAFRGMFTENGYASHTPVTDGERIYAFFGMSGVIAFDMEGKELWHGSVGTGKDPNDWGSASSPILTNDLLIVTAAAESSALVALDKATGKEVWRQEAESLQGTWGTPVLVAGAGGEETIVLAVPGEVWGVNPASGKLRWYAAGPQSRTMCASAIGDQGVAYVIGGRDSGSIAVRTGGRGDVTENEVVWSNNHRGGIGTPLYADGLIYGINGGVATCLDAATGERVYQERLTAPAASDAPASEAAPSAAPPVAVANPAPVEGFGRPGQFAEPSPGPGGPSGPGGFGGGRGGGGGGMRQQDYSSPILADGKLYFVRRGGEAYVLAPGREFKQLAVNKFASDDGDFSATPAVSDGALFIRSSKKLYCVGE